MALEPHELVEFVHTTAEFLNVRYFDGALTIKIEVANRSSNKWYARYMHISRKIVLNPALGHATIPEIEEIIVHEMIHVAQHVLGVEIGHGKSMRDIAKKFGIPVNSARRCTSNAVRTPLQMRVGHKPKGG